MRAISAALGVIVCVVVFAVFSGKPRAVKNIPWKSLETLPISVSKILGLQTSSDPALSLSSKVNGSVYKGKLCILLTVHGHPKDVDANNIQVFTPALPANAPAVKRANLEGLIDVDSVRKLQLQNLRGMTPVNDVIFVASAHSTRSKIIVVPKCGYRHRNAAVFSLDKLAHPYGVEAMGEHIYVTNQNDNTVVMFRVLDGRGAKAKVFAHVKKPRGLSFDNEGRLWVASTKQGVLIFNQDASLHHSIKITHPVGIVCDRNSGLMYVGSYAKGKGKTDSKIHVFDPDTLKSIGSIRPPSPHKFDFTSFRSLVVHPAGLAIDPETNVLFAVAQEARMVYAFNVVTREYLGAAVTDLSDDPEQLLLSTCTY